MRCIIILVDSREQSGPYIMKRLAESGIESDIVCWPTETGTDYFIQNTHGSCAVQRKVVCSEMLGELDEIMYQIIPALKNFSDNPVLLLEENFGITKDGYLENRNDGRSTEMLATSYFSYLETIRKLGVDVQTTRDLNSSIWWMIAMHGYLAKNHYPKHKKYFSVKEQAVGMMSAVSGIGEVRALKALSNQSIRAMCGQSQIEGLTMKQSEKLQKVLRWKEV